MKGVLNLEASPHPLSHHEDNSEGLVWNMRRWWRLGDSAGLDWAQVR